MNTILLKGDWNILKGKLKQTWALLTHDDLEFREGKADEFLGRILKKTSEKRAALLKTQQECDDLRVQIDDFPKWSPVSIRRQRPRGIQRKEMCCGVL